MAKYKVCFSGYAYVEAGSEEEAREKYRYDDEIVYNELSIDSTIEVAEFVVEV